MALFGFVHGAIRFGKQFLGGHSILRIERRSHADGDNLLATNDPAGFHHSKFYPGQKFPDGRRGELWENQNKFVSAETSNEVVLAANGAEIPGDLFQEFVTDKMSEIIVYSFESVEVAEQDGQRLAAALGARQLGIQMRANGTGIG